MTIRHQFTVPMRGRRVTVLLKPLRDNWGEQTPGLIRLDCRADDGALLDAAVHEALHQCMPDLDEVAVDETAQAIGALLSKLGFRREDEA